MKYLFLDDERMPRDVTWVLIGGVGSWGADWQIVRSLQEAKDWVIKNGFPDVISFDHDLGVKCHEGDYSDENTGYDFAKWLVEYDIETNTMPDNFKFTVHSKNPIGAENIQTYLGNYLQFKKYNKY
jgi:hypothetical protein